MLCRDFCDYNFRTVKYILLEMTYFVDANMGKLFGDAVYMYVYYISMYVYIDTFDIVQTKGFADGDLRFFLLLI